MKKIAIIGAGISGLFFANLIEKNKYYSYKIFERKNSIDLNDGYGIQLSVNSIKLLNNIGFNKFSNSKLYFPKKVSFLNAKDFFRIKKYLKNEKIYHHIGIYAFTIVALTKYVKLSRSKFEIKRKCPIQIKRILQFFNFRQFQF